MKKLATLALLGALLGGSAQAAMNIPVVSGGVGEEGRAAIINLQKDFTLKAVFTGQGGIYLSDVDVRILDRSGNMVVSNVTQGPMLLAALPPGRYILQANAGGYTQRTAFTVGRGGLRTLMLRFPVTEDSEGNYVQRQI